MENVLNSGYSKSNNIIKYTIFGIILMHVFLGIILNFTDAVLYNTYITEDGYVEYLTAFGLLGLSVICFRKGMKLVPKWKKAFFLLAALVFFFGFGEEISWAQRIIGFGTPEKLEAINTQREFSFHNIKVNGIRLNKLIFGTGLYIGVFTYFFIVPYLYRKNKRINELIKTLHFPVPTTLQSGLYLFCFAILHIIPVKSWEIQELTLASFLLLAFLFPANKEDVKINLQKPAYQKNKKELQV